MLKSIASKLIVVPAMFPPMQFLFLASIFRAPPEFGNRGVRNTGIFDAASR
jgi:hypothetical protein